jgi:hypothetical protein
LAKLFTFAHGGEIKIGEWCYVGKDRIWSAAYRHWSRPDRHKRIFLTALPIRWGRRRGTSKSGKSSPRPSARNSLDETIRILDEPDRCRRNGLAGVTVGEEAALWPPVRRHQGCPFHRGGKSDRAHQEFHR